MRLFSLDVSKFKSHEYSMAHVFCPRFITICQACHKGRKLSANNGQKISFFKTIQKRFQLDSTSEKSVFHNSNLFTNANNLRVLWNLI